MQMRKSLVALAVAGVLGGGAASAANLSVYISGASAQRTFWVKDLQNLCGVANTAITQFSANLGQSPNPDFLAVTCTATASAIAPVANGDTVTLYYSAELGSEWGIAPGLGALGTLIPGNPYPTTHLFLTGGNTTSCTLSGATAGITGGPKYNCPGTSAGTTYSYVTDTVSGGGSSFFAQHAPDIVAADIEPKNWSLADNWAGTGGSGLNAGAIIATALGPVPTKANLAKLQGKGGAVSGQIFGVILNNGSTGGTTAVPGGLTNLSHKSLESIFQGAYTTWSQVPEVGPAGDPGDTIINVCRRDHGSGTQAAASLFYTQSECGTLNSHAFVSLADANFMDTANVFENNTGSNMAACVTGHNAAIGFATLAPSATYTTISVDGAEPNAHNAAAGIYGYAFETFLYNITKTPMANAIVSRAKSVSTLASVLGTETVQIQANGMFHVTSGNPIAYYGLAVNNSPSVANLNTGATKLAPAAGVPTEIFSMQGDSCSVSANVN
jgi:ABC-type phosphate transport system substrate-binding protein